MVTVARGADGITITSNGRLGAPINVVTRQFKARYDAAWKPLELTIDASLGGQDSTLTARVAGTTATVEVVNAPNTAAATRTDTIDAQAILLPNPFIAPYEAVSARAASATPGTTLFLYQPGQGLFTAIVGNAVPERIQTVDRVINAKRIAVTFQMAGRRRLKPKCGQTKAAASCASVFRRRALKWRARTWRRCRHGD